MNDVIKEIRTLSDEEPSRPLIHKFVVEIDGTLTLDFFLGEWRATRPLERYDTPFVMEEIQKRREEIELLKKHLRKITTTKNVTIERCVVRDEWNNKDITVTRINNVYPENGTIQMTLDDYKGDLRD